MSTRPEQSWSLWCDWPTCKHQFEYGDYSIFGDGYEPDEIVRDADGWVGTDGKHYCHEHLTVWPSDHEDNSPYPAPPFLLIGAGDPLVDTDGTVQLVTHLHASEPCVKPEACPRSADQLEARHYDALITAEGVR